MSSLSLGRYVPYNSVLHRLDPRGKLAAIIALMVSVFISLDSWSTSFIYLGALLVITAILLYISRMSISAIFSSMKTLWIVIIILLFVYALLPVSNPELPILFKWGDWTVYWDSLLGALKIILRLVIMLSLTMVLTATTKPLELTYALEWYFLPLKKIKFPAAEIAMTISIALRFIPTLLDDTTRIIKAQESRGVDFLGGNIFKKIATLTSLVVPLFVSAFTRSEELANAMECRCYDPRAKRSKYRVLKWKINDTFAVILANIVLAGFIVTAVMHFDLLAVFGVQAI